jgi:hypothetical protein
VPYHSPDQYMVELRQILAQGRKRLGFLLGAGCPASIPAPTGAGPLVPTIAGLTTKVIADVRASHSTQVEGVLEDLGRASNVEQVLSRVRALADVLRMSKVHGGDAKTYAALGEAICSSIGKIVDVELPVGPNSYAELAGWIGGVSRVHAVEIFTPNYDLLMEYAFERARIPYFDGFSGAVEPFFDASTIAAGDLPPRWARIWKVHGSLGWGATASGDVVRNKGRYATALIYPAHQKYNQTQKLPYSALLERLRQFLLTPDVLLITSGFSFSDAHLTAIIDEALSANPAAAVAAFQYGNLADSPVAVSMSQRRANMSVYAFDAGVINGISADWRLSSTPHPSWEALRPMYWGKRGSSEGVTVGDFGMLVRFVAQTRAGEAASW